MITESLFPDQYPAEDEEAEPLSWQRRLTLKQRKLIANGVHPVSGQPLLGGDATCRTCAHLYRNEWGSPKCDASRQSRGPLTDIRLSWPACRVYTTKAAP